MVVVFNHPKFHISETKKIEKVIGEKCCLTHIRMSSMKKRAIEETAKTNDLVLFFSSAMDDLLSIFEKDHPLRNKIHILRGSEISGDYSLHPL